MKNKRLRKIEFLCRHTLRNLPDSSSLRRELLEGVLAALPVDNAVRDEAAVLLHHMNEFDSAQRRLQLELPGDKGNTKHDGHHGNGGDGQ